jgi:type I restriction-modification system DNA methylase subunit
MITKDSLLRQLGYNGSPHYCRVNDPLPPETAHLFRSAGSVGLDGIYSFETGPGSPGNHYKPSPAVYVAEAEDENKARLIHRKLWNLYFAPFVIILLPHQVRVYTGFNYSEEKEEEGLLDKIQTPKQLNRLLEILNAVSIDTGLVWKSEYAEKLDPNQRVDRRLLKNIKELGNALIENGNLKDEVANALIGKFVYLKYLLDRNILTNEWMHENHISPGKVFSLKATVLELKKLVNALEKRFNGKIFPIDFDNEESLKDEHIKWVAAIFSGAEIVDRETTPEIVLQLHLPFKAYDFEYIPVETLSAIYEQFIFDRKTKGAVYTPEALADYLIAEMESVKPLERGMKILDPACGSGIFLVLIYRLLIEKEIQRQGRKLKAEDLLDILEKSIYGVEREPDACCVAEFSLILTLLHYLEPRDLQNLNFRFPYLHNRQIFQCDFFDIKGEECDANIRQKELKFDWIIGNPPWIMLKTDSKKKENKFAYAWMNQPGNKTSQPVGDLQTAEAFSWLVTGLLSGRGVSGLILPAPSLFNIKARYYRQKFFSKYEILKITNFSNLREIIWGKRENKKAKNKPTLPPAVLIYRLTEPGREKANIIHYGPFSINQLIDAKDKPWVITINENEIKRISPVEVETGETLDWKLALWGNYIDKRVIERIKSEFPKTLKELCEDKKWTFCEGPQLRNGKNGAINGLKYIPELKGKKQFDTVSLRESMFRFSVPSIALTPIPDGDCYIRKRGGELGLNLTYAPHIIISYRWMTYIIFSDEDFVIPPRHIGIAAHDKENDHYLRAISVYLKSSLVAYYLFFHSQQWGVFRHTKQVTINDVREIPTPDFTTNQVGKLADLQEKLVTIEKQEISKLVISLRRNRLPGQDLSNKKDENEFDLPGNLTPGENEIIEREISKLRQELQRKIDENIYDLLEIPQDIRQVVNDFFETRLPLDSPSKRGRSVRKPTPRELKSYARELRDKLDDFLMGESFNRVTLTYSDDLIECIIEVTDDVGSIPIDSGSVKKGNKTMARLMAELADNLRRQVSQWVYIQRGLRLFDGPSIHLYKSPRIIDWTRTQARIDAGDIIGELTQRHDD